MLSSRSVTEPDICRICFFSLRRFPLAIIPPATPAAAPMIRPTPMPFIQVLAFLVMLTVLPRIIKVFNALQSIAFSSVSFAGILLAVKRKKYIKT